MPAIPLPFVVVLLLVILTVRLFLHRNNLYRPALIFICACLIQTTLVGLRWSYGFDFLRIVQAAAAAVLPPLAWLAFSPLHGNRSRFWPMHFLPAIAVFLITLLREPHIPVADLILLVLYLGYGGMIAIHALRNEDHLDHVRLSQTAAVRKAALFVGLFLVAAGLTDLLIAADFRASAGAHVLGIISLASMLTLPAVAYAIMFFGSALPQDAGEIIETLPEETTGDPPVDENDERIFAEFSDFMNEKQPFRDPDLTLNRLSRRLRIPARQLSGAINRKTGKNMSQVVNEYRIRDAEARLKEAETSITSIMFDCGFQTKSNFNREFLKLTGMTPSEYRRQIGGGVD